jgi:hypothetical protein
MTCIMHLYYRTVYRQIKLFIINNQEYMLECIKYFLFSFATLYECIAEISHCTDPYLIVPVVKNIWMQFEYGDLTMTSYNRTEYEQ